nr:MAG TPA: hypothetical protein [Caudoviricetes sp.]
MYPPTFSQSPLSIITSFLGLVICVLLLLPRLMALLNPFRKFLFSFIRLPPLSFLLYILPFNAWQIQVPTYGKLHSFTSIYWEISQKTPNLERLLRVII